MWGLPAFAALLFAGAAHAQGGTVAGRVVGENGQPLVTARVVVTGTELRTVTGPDGRFRFPSVPAGRQTLTASQIGYSSATQTVAVQTGQTIDLSFRLAPSALALDELVVTGTAGATSRREQPAVVATVDVEELTRTRPINSVRDVLTGRVPGVAVTATSGTSGTSQRINIRGASSISLSNEPLVFIDGVRVDSRSREPFGFGIGGQAASRLFDLDPEEIESIEVVKGPAAATLYGSDASAGVIQIITKRGRAGGNRFSQNVSLEYNSIDPNYTPPANFGVCTAAMVADTTRHLCRGQAAGTVVSDNPLQRSGAFRTGNLRSLGYSARGGGENYGYFLSLGVDDEEGTLPNNALNRRNGRFNFTFIPNSKLSIEAGTGFSRTANLLPNNDNNIYGYLTNGLQGSPLTVGSRPQNGYQNNFRDAAALALIRNELTTLRYNPTLQVNFTPVQWFTHRFTVGADVSQGAAIQFYPKNSIGFYQGQANLGRVNENRNNYTSYTLDYLGNIKGAFGADDVITSDLSFGVQVITERVDALSGTGIGLPSNQSRTVGSAAQISADQAFTEDRTIGILAQEQIGFRDRLFLQIGGRLDQNSSFGEASEPVFLPKVGVSWVVSEEPFFERATGFIPTLRLRAAYGETGRSPAAGASLRTFEPAPFAELAGTAASSAPGVIAGNAGNSDLRPERGRELEAGVEMGLFRDRVGVELTYFNKRSTDLLVRRPLPPSEGFQTNPFINLGESSNQGIEYSVRANVVRTRAVQWDVRVAGSRVKNELLKLGVVNGDTIQPFGTLARFTPGRPLGSQFTRRILSVDTIANRVIVSDTIEYVGQPTPTFEGNLQSTVTLRNLTLGGQLDWKGGFTVYNRTRTARERGSTANAERIIRPGAISQEERLRLVGPYFTASGTPVAQTNVLEEYLEDGTFARLRELSASVALPRGLASRFRADGATFTLAAQNLKLWTEYTGADPEVISTFGVGQNGFLRDDFFTVPAPRRLVAKLNLQF